MGRWHDSAGANLMGVTCTLVSVTYSSHWSAARRDVNRWLCYTLDLYGQMKIVRKFSVRNSSACILFRKHDPKNVNYEGKTYLDRKLVTSTSKCRKRSPTLQFFRILSVVSPCSRAPEEAEDSSAAQRRLCHIITSNLRLADDVIVHRRFM